MSILWAIAIVATFLWLVVVSTGTVVGMWAHVVLAFLVIVLLLGSSGQSPR